MIMLTLEIIILVSLCLLSTLLHHGANDEFRVAIAWAVFILLAGFVGAYSLFILGTTLITTCIAIGKKIAMIKEKIKTSILPLFNFSKSNNKEQVESYDLEISDEVLECGSVEVLNRKADIKSNCYTGR